MNLFSVTCTTCKSRLKVRDEAAIGHILACPKCGGMVMVRTPEGWQPGMTPQQVPAVAAAQGPLPKTAEVEARGVDETQSESHFDAVDDLLSDAPPRAAGSSRGRGTSSVEVYADAPGLARPRFVGAPPQPAAKGDAKAESPAAPANKSAPDAPPGAEKPGQEEPADDEIPDWQPQRPRRYWILLAGSIAGGIALAVSVVLAVNASRGDADAGPIAANSQRVPATNDGGQKTASPLAGQPAEENPPAVSPALQPPGDVAPTSVKPIESTTQTPASTVPTAPEPPSPANSGPGEQPAVPPAGQAATQPAIAGGNSLSPFDRLLAPDDDPLDAGPVPTPGAAPGKGPTIPPPAAEPEAAKPALPRPAPRAVNVAARLADPLPAIETEGTPLADFLQVLSELSTIPITLEPDPLPMAKVSAVSPVTLKLSGTTIGGALAAGAGQLKLETVQVDDQLLVRLVEPQPIKTRPYAVKDLTGGDAEQAADLADLLRALVEPASWGEGDDAGAIVVAGETLQIRQRSAVHAQLMLALDKLRTARGLKPQTSWLDPALFALRTRSQRAAERLQTPVTLTFPQPTPVIRILKQLEDASGVRILVDWRDLAAAGWNPDGEATLSVEKQPMSAALTSLVGPMDLAWRIVDGQTLQVVRPDTLASRCELEFYKVADLVKEDPTGESLLASVRAQLGEGLLRDRGGPGELRYDAASGCLLSLLPQPQQAQLAAYLKRGE